MSRVLGVDFGTASVRSLVVDTSDGTIVGLGEYTYTKTPSYSDATMARHHVDDYLTGLEVSIKRALADLDPSTIVGLGLGSTGSTILPVLEDGTPLLHLPEFSTNPNAHIWLWKDHTPTAEGEFITEVITSLYPHYLNRIGGTYSTEWFWSKILHCVNVDPHVAESAYTWIEIADYLLFLLSGRAHIDSAVRNICAASHKALYDNGYPSSEFLSHLDERLLPLGESLQRAPVQGIDQSSGTLGKEWAERLGLPVGITLGTAALDGHFGAVGSHIRAKTLVKSVGTSSVDITVAPLDQRFSATSGLMGVVEHSILPDMIGIEAGQSGVGDIFGWYVDGFLHGNHHTLMHEALDMKPGQSGLIALDWNHGNRSILQDQNLTGLLLGMDLATTPAEVYRALIEATAFGSKIIIDRIEEQGIGLDSIILAGGIPKKNPLLVQIYADVHNRPMVIAECEYASGLGSAIAVSVASGVHSTIGVAQKAMVPPPTVIVQPNKEAVIVYRRLFDIYTRLHDGFGVEHHSSSLFSVMKELLVIKNEE